VGLYSLLERVSPPASRAAALGRYAACSSKPTCCQQFSTGATKHPLPAGTKRNAPARASGSGRDATRCLWPTRHQRTEKPTPRLRKCRQGQAAAKRRAKPLTSFKDPRLFKVVFCLVFQTARASGSPVSPRRGRPDDQQSHPTPRVHQGAYLAAEVPHGRRGARALVRDPHQNRLSASRRAGV